MTVFARATLFFLLIFPLAAPAAPASKTSAAKFSFQPKTPLVSDAVVTQLSGLKPNEQVVIEASLKDELGRAWKSWATFAADKSGLIDLSKSAPLSGSYTGVDPMGLFWSMNLAKDEKVRSTYWHTSLTPIETTLTAKRESNGPVEGKIVRHIMKEGIIKVRIQDKGIVGNFFVPPGKGPFPGIIVLGGSEGGIPNDAYVAQFANMGFAALGLAYYRENGLPAHYANLPLEYFQSAIRWMQAKPDVNASRLAIAGSSTGGVTALLSAANYPEIRAAISVIGGSVIFQSLDPDPTQKSPQSPFTLGGKPLPFVPVQSPELTTENLNTAYYLRVFLGSLFAAQDNQVQDATIAVENINGPLLLIGADNDRLFGSGYLSARAYSRLTEKNFPYPYSLVNYQGAGHTLGAAGLPGTPTTINSEVIKPYGVSYAYGGNPKDTARAKADSWKRIAEFLKLNIVEAENGN
jgi:dienelactone hydrolase